MTQSEAHMVSTAQEIDSGVVFPELPEWRHPTLTFDEVLADYNKRMKARREAAAAEIRRQEKLARQAKKDEQDRIKLQEKKRREEVKAYWRLKKEFDTFVDERIALDKAREKKRSKKEKRNAKKLKKNISKSKDNSNNSTANENDNNNISHKSIPENKTSDNERKGKKSGLKPSLLKIRKIFVPKLNYLCFTDLTELQPSDENNFGWAKDWPTDVSVLDTKQVNEFNDEQDLIEFDLIDF